MPDVAPSMKATPIPPSHFASFRPKTKIGKNGEVIKEGKAVSNTSDIKTVMHKQDKLYQGRFNCSQCHAPQANIKPLVKNTFTPDFTTKNGAKRSNLIDVINEGVDVQ
jgi:cytochrome c-type protein NapB